MCSILKKKLNFMRVLRSSSLVNGMIVMGIQTRMLINISAQRKDEVY